jgi:hypothetical protein
MNDIDMVEIFCRVIVDGESAMKITIDDEEEIWISKSLIKNIEINDNNEHLFTIDIPEWLAIEKGLV